MSPRPSDMPSPDSALPDNYKPALCMDARHQITGQLLQPPPAGDGLGIVLVGMGCFWGAEQYYWPLLEFGLVSTAVGYAGGYTAHPSYEQVCSGMTGHSEVVQLVYQPQKLSLEAILDKFWEGHDPTQGMRQGVDQGTQYRSVIYVFNDADERVARESLARRQALLQGAAITTEVGRDQTFYYAEDYHQQYLLKNPTSSCTIGSCALS